MQVPLIARLAVLAIGISSSVISGARENIEFLHQVPAGTRLSLEKKIVFPPDSARAYFQNGEIFSQSGLTLFHGINPYRPYCILTLREAATEEFALSPRRFHMQSVNRDVSYEAMDTSIFRTQWMLRGGKPEPHAFTCYKKGSAAYERPLSLREIDRAVGGWFRLQSQESGE